MTMEGAIQDRYDAYDKAMRDAVDDADRFVKLQALLRLSLDRKFDHGFINAEVDCKTIDDWRRYLDSVPMSVFETRV